MTGVHTCVHGAVCDCPVAVSTPVPGPWVEPLLSARESPAPERDGQPRGRGRKCSMGARGGARRMTGTWPTGTGASPMGLLEAKATGGDHEATLLSINA